MSIRKSPHKRQRKKDDKGGSGLQWGNRTPQEVEMMGETKTADVISIGPSATKRLKKAGIVELSEVDEFKDAKTGDILQKETKLSGRQVQKLVSARERARDVDVQQIRDVHKETKSKQQKKLKRTKQEKREPRASSMKHFIKKYAYKRFSEHGLAGPSDQWNLLQDEIDWDGPVSEAWDITYGHMAALGFEPMQEQVNETPKVQIKRRPKKQIRKAYDQIRAGEPTFTGLIPIDRLKYRIRETNPTMTDKQIDDALLDMERKRTVDLQIAYDPSSLEPKVREQGIKSDRGLIMYVRYRDATKPKRSPAFANLVKERTEERDDVVKRQYEGDK